MEQKKIRVLLADDNRDFCETVARHLRKQNDIDMIEAVYDGIQAYERITITKPDVAILDSAMPGLDGLGVLEKLKKEQSRPVCIMLSGISNENIIRRAVELGAQYYIIKPFDLDTLAERIRMFGGTALSGAISMDAYAAPDAKDAATLEARVADLLQAIGILPYIRGYRYLCMAVIMAVDDCEMLHAITKVLYPAIAKKCFTTPGSVERAIRHAIESTWKCGGGALDDIFGHASSQLRPTNGQFIAQLASKLGI